MGEFDSLTGLQGPALDEVIAELGRYADSRGGELVPCEWTGDLENLLVVREGRPGHVTIAYPADFLDAEDASAELSEALGAPAFSFLIVEGALWMYVLFAAGEYVDGFHPRPDSWPDLTSQELDAWKGSADVITRHWSNADAAELAKYLVPWTDRLRSTQRACADDRFTFKDPFQVTDFMRRLGLEWPANDRGQPVGKCFHFDAGDA